MEPPRNEKEEQERDQLRQKVVEDTGGILSYFWPLHPIRLGIDLLLAALRLIQPLAPQLVPLLVFSISLPVILFLSVGSGYWVWKSVAVGWETEVFLQYGDGPVPFAEVALPSVVAQQPYDISLHLIVPANEANFALGNFMASLTLMNPSNGTIAAARKPAIVLPPIASPWSFLYNRPGTVDLNIPMLKDFVLGTTRALARVELGRRDQWKTLGEGHGREVSVLSGYIRGVVLHHGLRGVISRFPLASAMAASVVFFFIMFVGMVACLMPAVEWHFPSDADEQPQADDKMRRRRRSRKRPEGEAGDEKPRTKPSKRAQNSGSRSRTRGSRDASEQEVKTEPEEWDSSLPPTPGVAGSSESGQARYDETPPMRRRRPRTPQDEYYDE
ncbi:hypothetical protein PYCCODRAFT_1434461 [Trametes coccinea BRFM310]|uniref:Adipose-regulatory protein n=1 Tax=Trametes coccinea (strain BRFM310) TaxID=1353009 RepID=A0A1Y2IR02_TRAC3|nr:hypothetical protein PYCCODRAFT_1434461 [Trametes coccinea BRFM310]